MITAVLILAAALVVAAYLTYTFHKEDDDLPFITPTYTKEELENIKLAEELYNKDLRPVVAKKSKTKPASELEVIEPEFVEKVAKTSKVFPEDATINLEALLAKATGTDEASIAAKESKPEFPSDKPKKKRKYYPKKKK
jgi:hypothetical protein